MNEKTQSKSTVIQIPLDDIKPKSGLIYFSTNFVFVLGF